MANPRQWWTDAVVYQIYPRSFADGNGDGIGDLPGVLAHLDHLVALGVDALWLSPFFRSPMVDGGYDVADPIDVDPRFGTLADFDDLLAAAHSRGLRIVIDIVPNHVSSAHPWFQQAVAAGPGDPQRDRFIFRDGAGDRPPNNWPSMFGGPAWQRVADGQWYLHLFAAEQPDLNWDNAEVQAEFERVLRFWLDRGVDGFRMDVAHGLAKPAGLPDMDMSGWIGTAPHQPGDIRFDNDHVHDHLRMFRRVLDSYDGDRMIIGEAWVPDIERLSNYVRPDELNLVFNFTLLEVDWGAESFTGAITESLAAFDRAGAPCTWVLANHDVDRIVTRYGGGPTGAARARAAALLQLGLPGAAYVYNGDELGLPNAEVPDWAVDDPRWERSGRTVRGRDGERVPLPWSGDRPPYGFSTAETTWLPMPADWAALTVGAQDGAVGSTLTVYRSALAVRRASPDLRGDRFAWAPGADGTVSFCRGDGVQVVLNASGVTVDLPAGDVLVASGPLPGGLPPDTAVWLAV